MTPLPPPALEQSDLTGQHLISSFQGEGVQCSLQISLSSSRRHLDQGGQEASSGLRTPTLVPGSHHLHLGPSTSIETFHAFSCWAAKKFRLFTQFNSMEPFSFKAPHILTSGLWICIVWNGWSTGTPHRGILDYLLGLTLSVTQMHSQIWSSETEYWASY